MRNLIETVISETIIDGEYMVTLKYWVERQYTNFRVLSLLKAFRCQGYETASSLCKDFAYTSDPKHYELNKEKFVMLNDVVREIK